MWQLAAVAGLGLVSAGAAQLPIVPYFAYVAGGTYVLNSVVYTVGGRRRRALRRGA